MGRGTGLRNTKDRLTARREKQAYALELDSMYVEAASNRSSKRKGDINGSPRHESFPNFDLEKGRERLPTV